MAMTLSRNHCTPTKHNYDNGHGVKLGSVEPLSSFCFAFQLTKLPITVKITK
jgi:hypothetical protein